MSERERQKERERERREREREKVRERETDKEGVRGKERERGVLYMDAGITCVYGDDNMQSTMGINSASTLKTICAAFREREEERN